MRNLKDYVAFMATCSLILIPYYLLSVKGLISTSITPQQHCLNLKSDQSLCIYCVDRIQLQQVPSIITIKDQEQFKVIEVAKNNLISCAQMLQMIDYDANPSKTTQIALETERHILEAKKKTKMNYYNESKYHLVYMHIQQFAIVQIKTQSSSPLIYHSSTQGITQMRKLMSVEALIGLLVFLIYNVVLYCEEGTLQKEIIVNMIILWMILIQTRSQDHQYVLNFAKCLYVGLCLALINVNRVFLLILMGFLVLQSHYANLIGTQLGCLIFFIYAKGSKYYTYIGSCLLILSLNSWLMEYYPGYLNDFPLKMIDYTILCTSTVMMEMLEPIPLQQSENVEGKGLQLKGFQKIGVDDEDEG